MIAGQSPRLKEDKISPFQCCVLQWKRTMRCWEVKLWSQHGWLNAALVIRPEGRASQTGLGCKRGPIHALTGTTFTDTILVWSAVAIGTSQVEVLWSLQVSEWNICIVTIIYNFILFKYISTFIPAGYFIEWLIQILIYTSLLLLSTTSDK